MSALLHDPRSPVQLGIPPTSTVRPHAALSAWRQAEGARSVPLMRVVGMNLGKALLEGRDEMRTVSRPQEDVVRQRSEGPNHLFYRQAICPSGAPTFRIRLRPQLDRWCRAP